jgi:uncharacterized membrane protein affecting hemolysin expression
MYICNPTNKSNWAHGFARGTLGYKTLTFSSARVDVLPLISVNKLQIIIIIIIIIINIITQFLFINVLSPQLSGQ